MKRILVIAVIGGMLGLAIGAIGGAVWVKNVSADSPVIDLQGQGLKPGGCCQLKHTIKKSGMGGYDYYSKGDYVGAPVYSNNPSFNDTDAKMALCPQLYISDRNWAGYCALDAIITFSDYLKWLVMALTVIMILIGAFLFVTAAGSSEQVTKAKKVLQWAIVGLVVALASNLIPSIARFFIGV